MVPLKSGAFEASEDERSRIAADIHDDALQILSALAVQLEAAQRTVEDSSARHVLARSHDEVHAAAVRLHQLIDELLPPPTESGLRQALEANCLLLFSESAIEYELRGDPVNLPSETQLLAYRLAQEALRNVLKHSLAGRVQVTLTASAQQLSVSIHDDGVGWGASATSTQPPTHAGLRIVRLRAEAFGGSVTTGVGLDGRGAAVDIRLPIGDRS